MLKEIIIKNFKSFRNEVVFTMDADTKRVSEYSNDHITNINNNHLLKVASMYGPNGGGKTNLINAITFMRAIVLNRDASFTPREVANIFNEKAPIELTIYFVDEKYEYGYSLVLKTKIDEDNLIPQFLNSNLNYISHTKQYKLDIEIENESMGVKKFGEDDFELIYERYEDGSSHGDLFEQNSINIPKLSKDKTLLNKLYEDYGNNDNEVEIFKIIRNLYNHFINIEVLGNNLPNIYFNDKSFFDFIEINKEKIIKYLNSVDIKISDINIYKEGRAYPIYFVREIEIDGKTIKREISFIEESAGTKKIFYFILRIMFGIKRKTVFLCDDMNSYLHPKLYESIVRQFTSKENQYSQLIFNSHDILNMRSELFRRDEIWFVYRDDNYSSVLIPLSNIVDFRGKQVRKDVVYSKQYLEGKFGSDPFIIKGLKWYE